MWWWLVAALAADPTDVDAARLVLSARDPVGCEALGAPSDALRAVLVEVVDTTEAPPWVPMRAAACVTERADADPLALDAALRWAADPALPGLALVVAGGLDGLSEPTARRLADVVVRHAATDPRVADRALPVLARSRWASVAALAGAPPK